MAVERFIRDRLIALNGVDSRDNDFRTMVSGAVSWLSFEIVAWEAQAGLLTSHRQPSEVVLSGFLAGLAAALPFFIEHKRQVWLREKKKRKALQTVFRR